MSRLNSSRLFGLKKNIKIVDWIGVILYTINVPIIKFEKLESYYSHSLLIVFSLDSIINLRLVQNF